MAGAQGSAAGAVGSLNKEHAVLSDAVRRLASDRARAESREDAPLALAHRCRALLGRYRDHMRREEGELFPRAQRVLRPQDWERIDRDAASRDDPLFGPSVDSVYQPIRDALMRRSWLRG